MQGHLEFYREHKISPVRYDLSVLDAFLSRRRSLYAILGLSSLTFRDASVLEVAAGTGQNSLYVASLMPKELVLLEPNPTAVEYIHEAYRTFAKPHTVPNLIVSRLEEYEPERTFDIVLCENWLGISDHELSLLKKLSTFVSPQGVLVITTLSPIGIVPNLMRRYLSSYLAPHHLSFESRTALLLEAYSTHLETISGMNRSELDWIQDNMINPGYLGIVLPIPKVLDLLGHTFSILGSSPSIKEDWRWFKQLYGDNRAFNEHFLSEYWRKAHNFLDYLAMDIDRQDAEVNGNLEVIATQLLHAIQRHEQAHTHSGDIVTASSQVHHFLEEFLKQVPSHLTAARRGLQEVVELVRDPSAISPEVVANMVDFKSLFGRETVYIALSQDLVNP